MNNLDSNTNQHELRFPMMENDEYQKAQNQEIKLGKEEGLDVSLYANPQFNWLQMEQIRMGLKDKWMLPSMRIRPTITRRCGR